MEKSTPHERKEDGAGALPSRSSSTTTATRPLSVMQALLGECLCAEPFPFTENRGLSQNTQFIELHGIEFISLGAMADELTPKQRVSETVEQLLNANTERLISIGYLVDDEPKNSEARQQEVAARYGIHNGAAAPPRKVTATVPLVVWKKNYPNDRNMSRHVGRTINSIKCQEFSIALQELTKDFQTQKAHPNRNINKFLSGITAHNMAVIYVLAGLEDKAISLFQEAVQLKIKAFGDDHPEVALSLDEIGIQLFARQRFDEALDKFRQAKKIRSKWLGPTHPKVAMVLNNIACCNFQMGNHLAALVTFQEARDIQQHKGTTEGDLDLLHDAITLSNLGYMKLHLKQYEEAQTIFQEALLIQQSVLGDDARNRAIKDTLNNIEFTNAFHS